MAIPVASIIERSWPMAASILGTAVAFGSLHSDVSELKAKQDTASKDHDAIVRMEQGQTDMKADLQDIKLALRSMSVQTQKK